MVFLGILFLLTPVVGLVYGILLLVAGSVGAGLFTLWQALVLVVLIVGSCKTVDSYDIWR